MTVRTVGQIMDPTDIAIPPHLESDAEIPVLTGLQAQGDVLVLPASLAGRFDMNTPTPVTAAGVEIIRGADGRNPHLLVADGPVMWDAGGRDRSGLGLGLLDVPEGSVAFLLHPEHGANGIGAGRYSIRQQRQMTAAGEQRVAD